MIVDREIDTVTYDEETMEVLEQCKGCPIGMPFSWKVCLQCNRERLELFRVRVNPK